MWLLKVDEVVDFSDDPSYNPALKEPFTYNTSLQQLYKYLPYCNEQDVEKLRIIWDVIHKGGDNMVLYWWGPSYPFHW